MKRVTYPIGSENTIAMFFSLISRTELISMFNFIGYGNLKPTVTRRDLRNKINSRLILRVSMRIELLLIMVSYVLATTLGIGPVVLLSAVFIYPFLIIPLVYRYYKNHLLTLARQVENLQRNCIVHAHKKILIEQINILSNKRVSTKNSLELIAFGKRLGWLPTEALEKDYAGVVTFYWKKMKKICVHYPPNPVVSAQESATMSRRATAMSTVLSSEIDELLRIWEANHPVQFAALCSANQPLYIIMQALQLYVQNYIVRQVETLSFA